MKRIILCADDYGQTAAISQGIIALAAKKRLSAISCMTNAEAWLDQAKWLMPHQGQLQIGLHFNLTHGQALSTEYIRRYGPNLCSLAKLINLSLLRKLDVNAILQECHAQFDQFTAALHRIPQFIDGHQHVQQFPQIRDAIIKVYQTRMQSHGGYVRWVDVQPRLKDILDVAGRKKIIIQLLGAKAFKKALITAKIPHNLSFGGVYSFARTDNYSKLFPEFLKQIADGGLIMCHPGWGGLVSEDIIADARMKEYEYFGSDQFLLDCQQQNIVLDARLLLP